MKEQPIVYVMREMYSIRNTVKPVVVGYVVSKAYLESETTRYLPNGDIAKEYEVEFIGYADTERSLRVQDVYLNSGAGVFRKEVYDDFASCKKETLAATTECFREQKNLNLNEFDKVIELAGDHARYLQLWRKKRLI